MDTTIAVRVRGAVGLSGCDGVHWVGVGEESEVCVQLGPVHARFPHPNFAVTRTGAQVMDVGVLERVRIHDHRLRRAIVLADLADPGGHTRDLILWDEQVALARMLAPVCSLSHSLILLSLRMSKRSGHAPIHVHRPHLVRPSHVGSYTMSHPPSIPSHIASHAGSVPSDCTTLRRA